MINAWEFDVITNTSSPIYPLLARKIIERTGKSRGRCLELGCGEGHLGMAMAEITQFTVTLYDSCREALILAEERIQRRRWKGRIAALEGDIHRLPFADGFFDLVINKGSIRDWENHPAVFREIYRVMAPGGRAYLGCGWPGKEEDRRPMGQTMNIREGCDRGPKAQSYPEDYTPESIAEVIRSQKISRFQVIVDESGTWFDLSKP